MHLGRCALSTQADPTIESISAVTIGVADMARSVRFYEQLGFRLSQGAAGASFTSFKVGPNYLNLVRQEAVSGWGRIIFYVSDVDATYNRLLAAGVTPDFEPRDASWGERYFHVRDPDGHELSFARPIQEGESIPA
jgi:catechol 2,3-dioxygenase-like lactoylglutathione lyase family enzyme